MPSQTLYIQDSLELNLFFLRIMKEHALFMQLGFTPKNKTLAAEAENLGKRLNELFRQAIRLAKGYVSEIVMTSGELFTRFTEEAERQTQFFTGAPIDMSLTREEYNLGGGATPPDTMKSQVDRLNQSALGLATELLQFKERVFQDVMSCRIITMNYPLQIDHLIREARNYIGLLEALLAGDVQLDAHEFIEEIAFWNRNMGEHAEFIDGLLDPTEKDLKQRARGFAVEFENLEQQAETAQSMMQMLPEVAMRSETATENLRNFKMQGANGILSCDIRSIIIPLLSDHVLREANYYFRVLNENMK